LLLVAGAGVRRHGWFEDLGSVGARGELALDEDDATVGDGEGRQACASDGNVGLNDEEDGGGKR